VTHDWLPLSAATRASGGEPVVASEAAIVAACAAARAADHVLPGRAPSATGTAGLAGLLAAPPQAGETVAVLFTG